MPTDPATVTPTPQQRARDRHDAGRSTTTTPQSRHVRFAPTSTSAKPAPTLKASEKKKYNKLSETVREGTTPSQHPEAIHPRIQAFTLAMLSQNAKVTSCISSEAPFHKAGASEPYIPNNVNFSCQLRSSDELKDDAEANTLIQEFNDAMSTFKITLSDCIKRMTALKTKKAKELRLQTFIKGAHEIFDEYVDHLVNGLDLPEEEYFGNTDMPFEKFAAISLIRFVAKDLKQDYCWKYLDESITTLTDNIAKHVTRDVDTIAEIKLKAETPDPSTPARASTLDTNSTTKLTRPELILDKAVRKQVGEWFKTATITAQSETKAKANKKAENARILARREAKAKENASSSVAAAIQSETIVAPENMGELIDSRIDKRIALREKRNRKKQARKNSSGGPTANQAQPGNGNARNGQSRSGLSNANSKLQAKQQQQQQQRKSNKAKAKNKKDKPQKGKGAKRGRDGNNNPAANAKGGRNAKRQRRK